MFYEPKDGHGLPHDPFKAIVAPRPIGWISTRSPDGLVNLAPYSFFNAVASHPPIVMFSSDGDKDSLNFARESGVFVCNYVGESLRKAMNQTSIAAARGTSEFELAGLRMEECSVVDAPRVADAEAALECRVTHIYQQRDHAGRHLNVWTVFGEVVGVHIQDRALKDGLFDVSRARPVMRAGYLDYATIDDVFQMHRPR